MEPKKEQTLNNPSESTLATKASLNVDLTNDRADFQSLRARKKEEARERKRKLIEESGGVRPRALGDKTKKSEEKKKKEKRRNKGPNTTVKTTYFVRGADGKVQAEQGEDTNMAEKRNNSQEDAKPNSNRHRFGRVMDQVPCTNKPRYSTVSMAVPGSVVANCQTRELRTVVVGQIARAAAVYHVDEIIIFDDNLSSDIKRRDDHFYKNRNKRHRSSSNDKHDTKNGDENKGKLLSPNPAKRESEPHTFMARVLQYCECPQYLRRTFFPMHPDLQFAGLLHPLDAPHHVRAGERSKYREGVVLDKVSASSGMSLVNVGIMKTPVEINMTLTPGIRCTVELDPKTAYQNSTKQKKVKGRVVSPNAPKEDDGTYWGYTTRLASSIKAVFDECPYDGGYDLKIGTSERGDVTVDDVNPSFQIPNFKHLLVVFGGVAGIEECVDADETFNLSGKNSKQLFNIWVNTCPFQGSRTIRTEEAVLISLARLRPFILKNKESDEVKDMKETLQSNIQKDKIKRSRVDSIEFSDEYLSDESSGSE